MYWTIAKKEFFSNLLNFRFVAGFILCFLLATLSAWIVTADYAERIANYSDAAQRHEEQLKDAKVFSEVKVTLDKRPEPLGLFCVGVEKQPGNTVIISHGEAPNSSTSAEQQSNPLLAGFPSLDLSLIVQVVFSLLALLFVYDSISGEKEHGTLSLILANAVPRHQVLLGKYLGIFLSLFVPILASMLAVIAIIILSPSVDFSSSDWIRLGLISFVSLLYISAFCNIGFFVSNMTGRSTTSAMFLLLTWVMFILLIPRGSAYIANYVRPATSLDLINARIDTLWDEYRANVQRFAETHPYPHDAMAWWDYRGKIWIGERRLMMHSLEEVKFREPLRIEYADKVGAVMEQYFRELEKQASFAKTLARISPVATYQSAASALAKTDTQSYLAFMQRTKNYRRELIDYLRSKRAFGLLFFTRQKEEDMFDGEEFEKWAEAHHPVDEWRKCFSGQSEKTLPEVDPWKQVEPLDLSDMPRFHILSNEEWIPPFSRKKIDFGHLPGFSEKPIPIADAIQYGMLDGVLLMLFNLIFFMGAYVAFLQYDVR